MHKAIKLTALTAILLGTFLACNSSTTTTSDAPTQPSGTLKTTHTFMGNGAKKTDSFTVGNQWKLKWSCDPASFGVPTYNVIVSVKSSDGTPIDESAVNSVCKAGNISGETMEHSGGTIYLDVNSEASWTMEVQEYK